MSVRTGIGYDSHRFEAGRPLVLGGVRIPGAERGLAGWSDADAPTHAVIDALLGAACLGDVGARYPDTDERWRGADSIELLRDAAAAVAAAGFRVLSVDATVLCEAPRLAPHREAMATRLGDALGGAAVNVKLSTNEGMGFVGRSEGIAALAVATLER